MRKRAHFCGALNGSVVVRDGETPEQAISRAEATLLLVLGEHAKRLSVNVGLEPEEGGQSHV